jgi:hypothetical protein
VPGISIDYIWRYDIFCVSINISQEHGKAAAVVYPMHRTCKLSLFEYINREGQFYSSSSNFSTSNLMNFL